MGLSDDVLDIPETQRSDYIGSWRSLLGAAATELEQGAALLARARSDGCEAGFVSEPDAIRYLRALGLIRFVSAALHLSIRTFKHWDGLDDLVGLVRRCEAAWEDVADAVGRVDGGESARLVKEAEGSPAERGVPRRRCSLSLLPLERFDTAVVAWDCGPLLAALANLWANRVSPTPPDLAGPALVTPSKEKNRNHDSTAVTFARVEGFRNVVDATWATWRGPWESGPAGREPAGASAPPAVDVVERR